MGALADGLKKRGQPGKCKFAVLIDQHADADDLEWISNPRTQHRPIAEEATKAWGEHVSDHTVRAHRRRDCLCYRSEEN